MSGSDVPTRIDEIADGIYRISTAVTTAGPNGFTFNQYLILDDEPLLYHTGQRRLFPGTRAAIERVMPVDRLRYIGFSHFEADECGAMNEFLAVAPQAQPVCNRLAAMTSVLDMVDRAPRMLADGETVKLGRREIRWFDTPHTPHAWECGLMMETTSRTLFCGDLFTQDGVDHLPTTQKDILGPSEALRQRMGYFAATNAARPTLERLAAEMPQTMACMHGSAWRGDGAALLRALADAVEPR